MAVKDRLLRWSPALLGGALALAGLGALGFASQGLRVSVAPVEEPTPKVDPIALLRDDVGTLQRDMSALSEGLGSNLESMARALDDAAVARSEAQEARLAQLERRLEQVLEQQRQQEALLRQAGSGAPARAEPVAAEPVPMQAADTGEPSPPAPPQETAPAAPPHPASASRPGLFSFKSSGGLDFDERLRFQVIGSLSRVGFDAKSTLHDFSGVTSEVEGSLALRLADPAQDGEGDVVCQAATLRTGVDGRDEEMRSRLETDKYPRLRFQMRDFKLGKLDRAARTVSGEVVGDMTIHGVTKPLRVPVRVEVDQSRRVVLDGEVLLRMSDYGIEPPTVGPITVQDEVKLWLSLRLRALGKAEPAR